ncbi:MAG: hypothetical protein RMJ15_00220 [Nitrososphaerota archaeon]|nr:hypothetical protein [Candidatus Bathyarchaeota archaeon]MDW8022161.1 hypothetical protein [Nitrososphaerota archaeon]
MSYSLQRLYRRLSTTKPSTFFLAAAAIALAVFLFGGGLYSLVVGPPPAAYAYGRFYFVYPSLAYQFWSDSIISMILYSLGIVGALFIYESTKQAYRPRQAYMMLIAGLTLLIVAYISIEAVIHAWKGV